MKSILILVLSCRSHRESRQAAVARTWARHAGAGQRVLLVEGGSSITELQGNRLLLNTPDSYDDLAEKAFRMYQYCHDNISFDGILKCDDDTYVDCARLDAAISQLGDYSGNPATDQQQFTSYARGGCYWLSRRAVAALVEEPFESHANAPWYKGNTRMRKLGEKAYRASVGIEDVMVGDSLHRAGFSLREDRRFHHCMRPTLWQNRALISNHYVSPAWMDRLERQRSWPDTLPYRLVMWLASLLPSANPPR